MDLTSKDRKNLPSDVFALPSKRMFPINDANHVRLANDMLDRAKGISDEERAEARRNILKRAKELGIDTSTWKNVHAEVRASAIAIQPSLHVNKMPFSGLFTWFDAASDYAPNGSGGRKVYIPKEVGIPALASLEGMAVNYASDDPDHHAPQQKIGVITAAWAGDPEVDGAIPVYVEGYIYAHDFPEIAAEIKAFQSVLGFSYETAQTVLQAAVMDGEEVAVTQEIGYFTGASILYKHSAAYTNTALAANKKEGDSTVDLQQILDAINSLKDYVDAKFEAFAAEDKIQDAADNTDVQASNDDQGSNDDKAPVDDKLSDNDKAPDDDKDSSDDGDKADVQASNDDDQPSDDDKKDVQASADDKGVSDVEALKGELAAMKTKIETLEAQNAQLSAQRRSIAYPQTLASKFDVKDENDGDKLLASISDRKDLSVEERLALKLEALAKQRNKA